MKQRILVLLAALAMPVFSIAQTKVTVYGFVDAGIAVEHGGAAGSVTKLASGIAGPNRLGFHATEDLGGGLKAIANLEGGLAIDTGATVGGALWGRQTYAGLSGALGTVTLGRQFTSLFTTLLRVGDPMHNGYAGQAGNLMTAGVVGGPRAAGGLGVFRSNMVRYRSPSVAGFTGELGYGFGEVAGDSSASRSWDIGAAYAHGPLAVALAHLDTNNATATDTARNTLLAANYDFGAAKAYAAFGVNKGFASVDDREYLLGVAVPLGASRLMASVIRKDDRASTANDATQLALAWSYRLSKRTELFTSIARISQDASNASAAFYSINSGAPGVPGGGDRVFNLGISHAF